MDDIQGGGKKSSGNQSDFLESGSWGILNEDELNAFFESDTVH